MRRRPPGRLRRRNVTAYGAAGSRSQALGPRHAELLFVPAVPRTDRSGAQLAQDIVGEAGRAVTVRAKLPRLRRTPGGVPAHRPYRDADGCAVELIRPQHPLDLLPDPTAPAVATARR